MEDVKFISSFSENAEVHINNLEQLKEEPNRTSNS